MIFRQSRVRLGCMKGAAGLMALAAGVEGYRLSDYFITGVTLCCFAPGFILLGWECLFPATLPVSKSGLTNRAKFTLKTWEWPDIADFQVPDRVLTHRLVAFNSRWNPDLQRERLRRWGVEANVYLPGSWTTDSYALAETLTKAKVDWSDQAAGIHLDAG